MLRSSIDHLVVTASSLADGRDFIRRYLGVELESGGEHQRMGTHNLLLRLGNDIYLEIIAVNPNAEKLNRQRWFELDHHYQVHIPRLATWVTRTSDIQASVMAASIPLGKVESMSRGELDWLITIPPDGSLPLQGVAPVLIQWLSGQHPASKLYDVGCSLVHLEGFHPEAERITQMLSRIGFEGNFSVSASSTASKPYLIAHIRTPNGECELRSSY